MARRKEGTTTGGYVCDAAGCSDNAIWAVMVVTPYLFQPDRPPIITMTDIHACHHHLSLVRRELVTEPMKQAIRDVATKQDGLADFSSQMMGKIGVHSGEYHRFQEIAGLIEPGDNVIVSDAPPLKLY